MLSFWKNAKTKARVNPVNIAPGYGDLVGVMFGTEELDFVVETVEGTLLFGWVWFYEEGFAGWCPLTIRVSEVTRVVPGWALTPAAADISA